MMIGKIFGEDFSRVEPKKPKNMAEMTDGKGLKDISLIVSVTGNAGFEPERHLMIEKNNMTKQWKKSSERRNVRPGECQHESATMR